MSWIVVGEEKGYIKLVSKSEVSGILPKGSYLTVEDDGTKFILRVVNSIQYNPYSPSPLIVDMDLEPLKADQRSLNIIYAERVKTLNNRNDGLIDFLRPQKIARRSTQEEIDLAIGGGERGPRVFLATIQWGENQKLVDDQGNYITTTLPEDMFYHQILICGKTGSGKTVAAKYLAQYFIEELNGAVLAINVKDVDFLRMYKPSETINEEVKREWENLRVLPHGIENFVIYYPATTTLPPAIDKKYAEKITLNVNEIDPDALVGLLQNISDAAAQSLPNIFRYWREVWRKERKNPQANFSDFVQYFQYGENDNYKFPTLNSRGEEGEVKLHHSTFTNIVWNLDYAREFFDNPGAKTLQADDILYEGKMSVINVAGSKGSHFGSILLRDLLHKIVESKDSLKSDVPILIIIDEVHQFYKTDSSREALGDLDTICRTGRSKKIGLIFSSQNPSDIPKGLATVINTKIFFNSNYQAIKSLGVEISPLEVESLKKGYAVGIIHGIPHLKIFKFPLALAGVIED